MNFLSFVTKVRITFLCALVLAVFSQTLKASGIIGLAKKAEIVDVSGGLNQIRITYHIHNTGTDTLTQIELMDDCLPIPSAMAVLSAFAINVTSLSPVNEVNLPKNTNYAGSGRLIENGKMAPGTSATVTLEFKVRLTDKFGDQTKIENNANIFSFDESFFPVNDGSNNGDTPIPGNVTPTLIPLTQIVIEAIGNTSMNKGATTVSETDGTMTYIIKRKGYIAQTSKVYLNIAQLTGITAARLGTSATAGVDAWKSTLTETLTFAYNETSKPLTINLVNDDMYEDNELFDIRLETPAAQSTNADYNNVSILIPTVKVTITSDDPLPVVNISSMQSVQIIEGTGTGSTTFNADVTLTGTHYATVTVNWFIPGASTAASPAGDFNTPISGTVTFPSGSKKQTITVNIQRDNIRETDKKYKIQLSNPVNTKLGTQSNLEFKIIDDDLRQIQWINNTPKTIAGRLDAGSEAVDTLDIHFLAIEASLDNPKIVVKFPAGVTYLNFANKLDDNTTLKVKLLSYVSNTATFVLDAPSPNKVNRNQKVHFKLVRKAACNTATGAKNDEVRVIADGDPGGVEEMTAPEKVGTGARVKYASYNVYLGRMNMMWQEGDNLEFTKAEVGTSKKQALKITNTGQGTIHTFDFYVKFNTGIVLLKNAKIRGTSRNLTAVKTTTSGFDTYKMTLRDADFAFIGNNNNLFESGEELIIEYDMESQPAKCGLKSETVWVDWACLKPAATLNTTISLAEAQGKPVLVRTLKTPFPIMEDGTPNNFVAELRNTGLADAHYIRIPLSVFGKTESFNINDITITIDGTPVTTGTKVPVGTGRMEIRGLVIPAGKTAIITLPVTRSVMDRYAGVMNMTNADYFSQVFCGDITYSDECEDPQKAGRIGYTYFNLYNQTGGSVGNSNNLSYIAELMTYDIARIDISADPLANKRAISFEFGTFHNIFPMYDRLNWFGGAGSSVEVTLTLTPNISLDAVHLRDANGNSDAVSFIRSANTYTINIPYNSTFDKYFEKNGKLEMTLQGECSGGSTINPISYTIDFITNRTIRHKLYKKSFDVLVKCNIDPGANLKGFEAKRINYIKGDANNDGIDGGGADVAVNTAKMRLDRLYHNDTIIFEYKVKIGQHNTGYSPPPACTPTSVEPWNILYATIKNLDATRLQHISSAYWIYDATNALIVDSLLITPGNQGSGKDYFLINRTGLAHRFEHNDSVIIRSLWCAKTITGTQAEKTNQLEYWTYCEMTPRLITDIFNPRTSEPCDMLAQNYEKEFGNISFYALTTATNGSRSYKHTFVTPYISQDVRYDHHLSVGVQGYSNNNFPYELRQPYYIDNMEFNIPYGYRITAGIKFFGYQTRPDLAYNRYPLYSGIITPEMQGTPHNISLTNLWDTNIWGIHNNTKGQVADEGWIVQPYFPIDVTPKANSGEEVVTLRLKYKSPSNLPEFTLGSMDNTNISEPGFILYNNAAGFVLSCGAPETVAFTDTVRWPVRITNNSSAKDVKNGWIYIDGQEIEIVKLIDRSNNSEIPGTIGFEGRWLKVGNFAKESYKDYYLVARYRQYHCNNDTMRIWPWHDYKEINETPATAAVLDTADLHVGRSVELYVINQQSEISGEITPLANTPKDPANPIGGWYNKDEIVLGKSFPVEITLSSNDIIAVKNASLLLNIPEGFSYIPDSAYYDWKGVNQLLHATGETQMRLINGSGTPVSISLSQITGIASPQLAGNYRTQPSEREVKLRFRLMPDCAGFNADSIIISAQIFGQRLCGDDAIGHNDTIAGRQIYLQGHRYYQMRDDIFTPDGNVFALCDDNVASRTIEVSFTRIGSGVLQDDKFEIKLPEHFNLNGPDPIRYKDTDIDLLTNPINISNTTSSGLRTIKWQLPREYSEQFTNNITVEYAIDLVLDVNAGNLPDKDTIVANVIVDQTQCPGDLSLLATDTLTVYIYTAAIGLAKEVKKSAPDPDGFIPLLVTYTITNYSNTTLVGVQLADNLVSMFGNMLELKDQFIITATSSDLLIDNSYQGMGNLIQAGEIPAGLTETIALQIWAKPTYEYDGRIFENNAQVKSANLVGCQANDISTNGLNPAFPDPDPTLNSVPTPLWFNVIRFKHNPPEFRIPESNGDLALIVERVGQDFTPATVNIKLENEAVQSPNTEPAKLGTSATYPIDAWWNSGATTQILSFGPNEREKTITIHIEDDDIYELTETFLPILFNEQYLISTDILSVVNDTVHVSIEDNDRRPTLNIIAVKDSVIEGTIPPAPFGCTPMQFAFKLTNPTYQPVTFMWQTSNGGTAVPGVDYQPQMPASVTIASEDSVAIVSVCIIADDIPELSKRVQAEMISNSVVNAQQPPTLPNRRAIATIVDDDMLITLVKLKHLTCKEDASGLIIISIQGGEPGTGTYEYIWTGPGGFTSGNNTITGLHAGQYHVIVKDNMGTTVSETYTILEPANPLKITLDRIQHLACNGQPDGLIETTASGGWDSPNYIISWTKKDDPFTSNSEDISNLTAGIYTISLTDTANCMVVNTFELIQPEPIQITDTTIHQITCKGQKNGNITIVTAGGTPPYSINWTGPNGFNQNNVENITRLAPGTYNLTITDSGACPPLTATFNIKEPDITFTAIVKDVTDVGCKGDATGMATIEAKGGWGHYTYTWSDGIVTDNHTRDDLMAGIYHVIVEDSAACSVTRSFTIREAAEKMSITLITTDETYQNGNDGTITVKVTGGDPLYTYMWADDASRNSFRNHLEAGTYIVTVTDHWKCVITDTAVINEPLLVDNLPNVFTPDEDGFNDKLLENFYIKVFNRWGYLLYEGRDGWDGKYKGQMMPAGVYFYVMIDEITGKEYKSSVLLQMKK